MSFLYVTTLVTIISLLQELHYIGILSFPLQKEKKKREEKTVLWLILNFSSGSPCLGRGESCPPMDTWQLLLENATGM